MIGVVVVTHSGLAAELVRSAEMILGPLAGVESVSVDRGMSVETAKEKLSQAINRMGRDGDGVLIMTDLFGGTPTNISAEFLAEGSVEILTGVNLPMLIKCVTARSGETLPGLAALLEEYARNAIVRPSDLLRSVK